MADRTNDTLLEIDAFVEAVLHHPTIPSKDWIEAWLAKIRAHAVADELERKRLQAEIMRSSVWHGECAFSEADVMRILELKPGWELAPQRAREAAKAMPPRTTQPPATSTSHEDARWRSQPCSSTCRNHHRGGASGHDHRDK